MSLRGGQEVREGREWRAGVPAVVSDNDAISGERRRPQPSSGPLPRLVASRVERPGVCGQEPDFQERKVPEAALRA